MKDLHKIGFSRGPVEKRIKNAEKSPTYLMAPVEVRRQTTALTTCGRRRWRTCCTACSPRSGSTSPRSTARAATTTPRSGSSSRGDVIDQAIELIMSGEIVDYVYDASSQKLIGRRSS